MFRSPRFAGRRLVFVDPRAAHRPVDDEDRHLLAGHEPFGQLHAPAAEFRLVFGPVPPSRPGGTTGSAAEPGPLGFVEAVADPVGGVSPAGRAAVTADPLARLAGRLLAGIGGQGVRLPVDEIGVAADQVADAFEHRLLPAGLRAELDAVLDQSRLELHREGVGLVGRERLGLGLEQLVVGIDFQEHGVGRLRRACRCSEACLRCCRRGRRTGCPRASRPSPGLRYTQGSVLGSFTQDLDRPGDRWCRRCSTATLTVSFPLFRERLRISFPGRTSLASTMLGTVQSYFNSPAPLACIARDWRSAARARSSRGRPSLRCFQGEDRVRNVLADGHRNVQGLHAVGIDGLEPEGARLVSRHAAGIEREMEPVDRGEGLSVRLGG